jgi:dolichyl-diphosphooligosaccharide--protein glycosyltransferase
MTDRDSPWYERYIPYGLLAVVFAYMVWIRTLPYSDVVSEEGVTFSANDPWYHIRVTEYLVENYPSVPPYDPWTYFPFGSTPSSGFGGLFDQIAATVAIIVGLGDPSGRQVELVVAFAPVFFGAATAIPVYFLARKITDKWVALLGAFSLALFGGQWLNRTTFANAQHQSAEAFFVVLAVLAFVIAIERTYAEKPTFAHFRDMDWSGLRKPIGGAVLAGLAFAAYVLTWPAAIYLAATLGLFLVVQMVRDHLNGRSTEYLAVSMAVTFLLSSVVVLIYVLLVGVQYRISGPGLSALQPIALAVVGIGVLFLHLVSDYLRKGEYAKTTFPAAVAGIFAVGLVALWLTGLISLLENLVGRMYSFGALTSEGALTVAEIQPATLQNAVQDFGLLIVVAGAGLVLLLVDVVRKDSPVKLAVLFWSVNMFSAYFTQARFGYYLGVTVAVLVAYGVYRVVQLTDLENMDIESVDDITNIKGYQIIALVLIVFLFLPVNVVAIGNNPNMQPAWNSVGAGGDGAWQQEALPWMEGNTPDISMDYNEGWEIPEDEDFDYNVDESPLEGDYGVMSWWDYGHWITHIGKRVPNANPFQEGNIVSSLFFTSQSEERADLLVEALPSVDGGRELEGMSNEELREVIESQEAQERDEDTRYVMIDDQMAAGKFGAIATWTDFEGFVEQRTFSMPDGTERTLTGLGDRYDNTTLSRLYYDDADGMSGYRLVHETETYSLIGSIDRPTQRPRVNRQIARAQYDNERALGNTSIPSINQLPDDQMLNIGGGNFLYDFRGVASVKTFERVEGATITGQANATDSNVLASVRLRTTNTDREFDYFREAETDENGRFEVTVPYATEGDVSVEEGGTNSTVEARGPYSVFVGENVSKVEAFGQVGVTGTEEEGRVNVTETDVYMGNEVEVELEEAGSGDTADGEGDEGTGTEGDGTENGGSEDGGTDGNGDQTQDDTSGDDGTGDGTSGGDGAVEDGSNTTDGGSPNG